MFRVNLTVCILLLLDEVRTDAQLMKCSLESALSLAAFSPCVCDHPFLLEHILFFEVLSVFTSVFCCPAMPSWRTALSWRNAPSMPDNFLAVKFLVSEINPTTTRSAIYLTKACLCPLTFSLHAVRSSALLVGALDFSDFLLPTSGLCVNTCNG